MSTIRERVYDYAKTCAAERAQRRGFPRPLWLVANYLSDKLNCQINELTEDDVWLFINTVGDEYIERMVNNIGPATMLQIRALRHSMELQKRQHDK